MRAFARTNVMTHDYMSSTLYVCMVNIIYLFSFVETPRKFIIAELSIRKLGSSSVLLIRLFEFRSRSHGTGSVWSRHLVRSVYGHI